MWQSKVKINHNEGLSAFDLFLFYLCVFLQWAHLWRRLMDEFDTMSTVSGSDDDQF